MLTNLMIAGTAESVRSGGATYPYAFPLLSVNSTAPGNDSADWTIAGGSAGSPTIFAYLNGWSLGLTVDNQFQTNPYAYQTLPIDASYFDDIDRGNCYIELDCQIRADSAGNTNNENHTMTVEFYDGSGNILGRENTFTARTTVYATKFHKAHVRPGTREVRIGWIAASGTSGVGTNAAIIINSATMVLDEMFVDAVTMFSDNDMADAWIGTSTIGSPVNRAFDFATDAQGIFGPSLASSFRYIDIPIPAAWAARVAAGGVTARCDFAYTNAEDDDEALVEMRFVSAAPAELGRIRSGDYDPIIDNYLVYRRFYDQVPAGCVNIRLFVSLTRADGTFLDAHVERLSIMLFEPPADFPGLIRFCDGSNPAVNGAALLVDTNQYYNLVRVDVDRNIIGSPVVLNQTETTFHGPNTISLGNWNVESVVWTGTSYDLFWWNHQTHELSRWVVDSTGTQTLGEVTTVAAATARGHDLVEFASYYN